MISLRNLSAAAAVALAATLPAKADLGRVTIGTNPQGTMYYVVGGGLSKLLSDTLGLTATAQPYAGSSVYLPLVEAGEVTIGFSSTLDSNMAYQGLGPYADFGGLKKLRSLVLAWPLPYTFFARADSGIRTVADLKGMKVAVDFRANAALGDANRAMLMAAGLDPDTDVEAVTITGIPEGYNLVTDGSVAAAATALGIPLARKADATIPGGIVMLGVTGENATTAFLDGRMPGLYMMTSQPGANNPGVAEPTPITGFDIFLQISADMSEEDAYTLARTIHENYVALQEDYPVLRRNQLSDLARPSNTTPFHPGAVRYYKEIGLWSEENETRDAGLTPGG